MSLKVTLLATYDRRATRANAVCFQGLSSNGQKISVSLRESRQRIYENELCRKKISQDFLIATKKEKKFQRHRREIDGFSRNIKGHRPLKI